jgi:hypothetical protein
MFSYYTAILSAYILKSIAGIPLLNELMRKRETNNIPYSFIILNLCSAFILFLVSMNSGYYIHSLVFSVYFIVYSSIMLFKYNNEILK